MSKTKHYQTPTSEQKAKIRKNKTRIPLSDEEEKPIQTRSKGEPRSNLIQIFSKKNLIEVLFLFFYGKL